MAGSLKIIKKGITLLDTDCIVNAANEALMQGGGVCGAIFKAAGEEELRKACEKYGRCPVGGAVMTPGFRLKARYIAHTVGPRWRGGNRGEAKLLYQCYQSVMSLVRAYQCNSVAFPLISAGIFGYPREEAWKIALQSILDDQKTHADRPVDVLISVLEDEMLEMGNRLLRSAVKEEIHCTNKNFPE